MDSITESLTSPIFSQVIASPCRLANGEAIARFIPSFAAQIAAGLRRLSAQKAARKAAQKGLSAPSDRPASPPAFRIPDVSPKVLWRLVKHYCDITYLFDLPDNDREGAWASNLYYRKKFKQNRDTEKAKPCSDATIRRYRHTMIDCGWIASLGSGPKPLFAPLVSPRKLLSFLPSFKRLLTRVLSGYRSSRIDTVPVSTPTESVMNSNKVTRCASASSADAVAESLPASCKHEGASPAPALSETEELVVVKIVDATGGEMTPKNAGLLLKKVGILHCQNALDWLRYYRSIQKPVPSPGGFLRSCAQGMRTEEWKLPSAVVAMVESERRAALHAVQLAEEKRQEEARRAGIRQQKERERVAAELTAKQVQAERLSQIPDTLRAAWTAALPLLRESLGVPQFEAHIKTLLPVRDTVEGGTSGNRTIEIETRGTGFTIAWLDRKGAPGIRAALATHLGCSEDHLTLQFVSPKKGVA